jgi:uncharacterized membrane protein YkoI
MKTGSENIAAVTVVLGLLLAPIASLAGEEVEIPLEEVPAIVLEAAKEAVPGIVITEAEYEIEDGERIYELEGTLGDKEYEIEVSEQGKVLEVEKEGDDEDCEKHEDCERDDDCEAEDKDHEN